MGAKNLPPVTPQEVAAAMDDDHAATYIGINAGTLRKWRITEPHPVGPPFFRAGKLVRYRRIDLDAWMEQQMVKTKPSRKGTLNAINYRAALRAERAQDAPKGISPEDADSQELVSEPDRAGTSAASEE